MRRLISFVLFLVIATGGLGVVAAQQAPTKVLVVTREFLKPGKGGMLHDKSESAYVQAFTRAKWPTHYVGMTSVSGKLRALFFIGYDSFDAWEKDNMAIVKDPTLSAALDHTGLVDGELLNELDSTVFSYQEGYSLHPNADLTHRRYYEITAVQLKPGHHKEWDDSVKMVIAAYEKAMPDEHWACYQAVYGMSEDLYIFITGRQSLSEVDTYFAKQNDFLTAMGDEGMKKLEDISAAAIESSETNLFAIDPRISYVPDELSKADPGFWTPKPQPAPASHKKAEAKPKDQ